MLTQAHFENYAQQLVASPAIKSLARSIAYTQLEEISLQDRQETTAEILAMMLDLLRKTHPEATLNDADLLVLEVIKLLNTSKRLGSGSGKSSFGFVKPA